MISAINILLAALWFFSAAVDYSDFCYIWQLKEYRIDRMRDFMSTRQGKDFWKRYLLLWRSLIAIIIFFWPINSVLTVKYFLILIFGVELLRNVFLGIKNNLRHPVLTKKAVFLALSSLFIEGGIFFLTRDWALLFLLMILRPMILSIAVILFNLPIRLVKKYYIWKAAKKISHYKNLIVIGVTGSYGKTSVKVFLSHILEKKFKVIKTPKNINTEIGIASFILKHDFKDKDIFVVEMGAYRVGEIETICDMVKPRIGILTAITEQHLSLFGAIKQTQCAKYELLKSLPFDGLAVINSDNQYCREYINELKCKVMTFGVDADNSPTCLIEEITSDKNGILCSGKIFSEKWSISAPIVGAHNAMNLAPCFIAAKYLGMSEKEIAEQSKTLEMPDFTLRMYNYGKSIVLDDSYNSNYNGFCAALDVLSTFSSHMLRVVITRGIPELGEKSAEIHEKIGGEIAYIADVLVIINKDFEIPLRKGIGNKYKTKAIVIEEINKLISFARELKDKNSVILLENRVPAPLYDELTGGAK